MFVENLAFKVRSFRYRHGGTRRSVCGFRCYAVDMTQKPRVPRLLPKSGELRPSAIRHAHAALRGGTLQAIWAVRSSL
jgi:hypothetical protein